MKKDIESIFSDKIRLSAAVITKEFDLIEMYNSLFQKLKQGELEKDDVILSEYFFLTWKNLSELYDFLEFGCAEGWGKIKNNEEEFKQLVVIIKKYKKLNSNLLFSDLTNAYSTIRKITEFSGFHDVARFTEEEKELNIEEAFR